MKSLVSKEVIMSSEVPKSPSGPGFTSKTVSASSSETKIEGGSPGLKKSDGLKASPVGSLEYDVVV